MIVLLAVIYVPLIVPLPEKLIVPVWTLTRPLFVNPIAKVLLPAAAILVTMPLFLKNSDPYPAVFRVLSDWRLNTAPGWFWIWPEYTPALLAIVTVPPDQLTVPLLINGL